jgi:hypothetical protein
MSASERHRYPGNSVTACARGKRPSSSRSAEKRDEFTPLHSITHSVWHATTGDVRKGTSELS